VEVIGKTDIQFVTEGRKGKVSSWGAREGKLRRINHRRERTPSREGECFLLKRGIKRIWR